MAFPVLTAEQRAGALAKAKAARAERAAALAALGRGEITLADVLADENHPLRRAKVDQVLRAMPRIGKVTAENILADLGIAASRRVAGLGTRQRAALAERLPA